MLQPLACPCPVNLTERLISYWSGRNPPGFMSKIYSRKKRATKLGRNRQYAGYVQWGRKTCLSTVVRLKLQRLREMPLGHNGKQRLQSSQVRHRPF